MKDDARQFKTLINDEFVEKKLSLAWIEKTVALQQHAGISAKQDQAVKPKYVLSDY